MEIPRGSQSLWKWIRYAISQWRKNRNRYSWLWCPICWHDLNGDDDSFIKESEDKMFWHYICSNCGCESKFGLYAPVPIIHSHQKFGEKLLPYKIK